MTGCSAPGCKSRSESGTKLFKVPANSIRREVWSACCGRQLMNSWRLCEHHFEKNQFESQRKDGLIKLKPNAIPTVFSNLNFSKIPTDTNHILEISNNTNLDQSNEIICIEAEANTEASNRLHELRIKNEENKSISIYKIGQSKVEKELEKTKEELQKCKRLLWRSQKEVLTLKKKNRKLTESFEKNSFLSESMRKLLACSQKTISEWPTDVMKLAIQIRFAVGRKNYNFLRNDVGLPLPCYSTLCSHMQTLDSNPEYQDLCLKALDSME